MERKLSATVDLSCAQSMVNFQENMVALSQFYSASFSHQGCNRISGILCCLDFDGICAKSEQLMPVACVD